MSSIVARSAAPPTNYYDLLKVAAIVSMIGDHVGRYLFHEWPLLTLSGRIAAPIFLFLVGFNLSTRVPFSLWTAAVIAQICFCLLDHPIPANILFSIALSRMLVERLRTEKWSQMSRELFLLGLVLLAPLSSLIFDYGTAGLLWVMAGRLRRLGVSGSRAAFYCAGIATLALNWISYVGGIDHICLITIYLCTTVVLGRLLPLTRLCGPLEPISRLLSRNALTVYVTHLIVIVVVSRFFRF